MNDELKTCPGCGRETVDLAWLGTSCWMECKCGWDGPVRKSRKAAIAAWNRRAGEEPKE
jgi:Lar family restriction alleviation protein